jgi:hypothetical protein
MTWYNYKLIWIDIEKCYSIILSTEKIKIFIQAANEDVIELYFKSDEERDAEFEKIKDLMGIKGYTSRCC